MARDPDAIEKEIEDARNALAGNLDELAERASPKRLADSGKEAVQEKLADPKVKYALIGVGAVVVLLVIRKLFR
ncbi:MAG TPA: DUF3618 domain-containing protein [Pseudonocardia sp.]